MRKIAFSRGPLAAGQHDTVLGPEPPQHFLTIDPLRDADRRHRIGSPRWLREEFQPERCDPLARGPREAPVMLDVGVDA